MRILLTRPQPDAEAFAGLLRERGVDSLIEPLLQVRFLAAGADAGLAGLAGVQALLLTSANGVRALLAACGGTLSAPLRGLPAYAVGSATAAVAREAGLVVAGDADGDAAALAALVAATLSPRDGDLLHVRAHHAAGDLSGALATAGFTVRPAVLYRTDPAHSLSAPAQAALRGGKLDGVALFSPRTASAFATLLRDSGLARQAGDLSAYCLSRAVAAAVEQLDWRRVLVATAPNAAALADLIAGESEAGGCRHEVKS